MELSFVVLLATCCAVINTASAKLEYGAFNEEKGSKGTNGLVKDIVVEAKRSSESCPEGYVLKSGDVPGWGSDLGGRLKLSKQECANKCNEIRDCLSFEQSVTEELCNLNRIAEPTQGPYKDFTFCVKEQASQEWCEFISEYECNDEYVKIHCPETCSSFDCEDGWTKFKNSCYKMTVGKKTWNDAESDCVKSGAHLASIHSAEENDFVNKLHDPTGVHYTWIGGVRDGSSFKWNDDSAYNYQNWNSGEPNNSGGKENCVGLYSTPGQQSRHGKWNDYPCDTTTGTARYVCKKRK